MVRWMNQRINQSINQTIGHSIIKRMRQKRNGKNSIKGGYYKITWFLTFWDAGVVLPEWFPLVTWRDEEGPSRNPSFYENNNDSGKMSADNNNGNEKQTTPSITYSRCEGGGDTTSKKLMPADDYCHRCKKHTAPYEFLTAKWRSPDFQTGFWFSENSTYQYDQLCKCRIVYSVVPGDWWKSTSTRPLGYVTSARPTSVCVNALLKCFETSYEMRVVLYTAFFQNKVKRQESNKCDFVLKTYFLQFSYMSQRKFLLKAVPLAATKKCEEKWLVRINIPGRISPDWSTPVASLGPARAILMLCVNFFDVRTHRPKFGVHSVATPICLPVPREEKERKVIWSLFAVHWTRRAPAYGRLDVLFPVSVLALLCV